MEEKERTIIIEKISSIILDAKLNTIKVKNIEDFFCKILDCHDKIKDYPADPTDNEAELTLKRAKAGWDILLPYYNNLTRFIDAKLSIDKIEKQFSAKWIPFFAELDSKGFEYETMGLSTIQEEQEESEEIFVNPNTPPASDTQKKQTALNTYQNMLALEASNSSRYHLHTGTTNNNPP